MRNLEINEEEVFVNTAFKIYRQMNCEFLRIQYKDETFQLLQSSMFTHGSTHQGFSLNLREAFQIQRQGDLERFFPFAKLDRKMLWHAAKPTELLHKLKLGLQAPISTAPSASYMFGKGIYFTDVVSKAAVNSFVMRMDKQCLLLLCDVAVGIEHRMVKPKVMEKAPKFHHSVVGVGKQAPANFTL